MALRFLHTALRAVFCVCVTEQVGFLGCTVAEKLSLVRLRIARHPPKQMMKNEQRNKCLFPNNLTYYLLCCDWMDR